MDKVIILVNDAEDIKFINKVRVDFLKDGDFELYVAAINIKKRRKRLCDFIDCFFNDKKTTNIDSGIKILDFEVIDINEFNFIYNVTNLCLPSVKGRVIDVKLNNEVVDSSSFDIFLYSREMVSLQLYDESEFITEVEIVSKKPSLHVKKKEFFDSIVFFINFRNKIKLGSKLNPSPSIYRKKEKGLLIFFLLNLFFYYCEAFLSRYLYRDYWMIFYKKKTSKCSEIYDEWIQLPQHRDVFVADPFLFHHNDKEWIFFEECPIVNGKGTISAFDISEGRAYRHIINEAHHLSFPNIFEFREKKYILPQSNDGKISLYIEENFPENWKIIDTLLESSGFTFADTIIFLREGEGEMFTNVYSHLRDCNKYCVKFKIKFSQHEELLHIQLKDCTLFAVGVSRSRLAGNIFKIKDEYYRPVQDCTRTYGGEVKYKKIYLGDDEPLEKEHDCLLISNLNQNLPYKSYGHHTISINDRIVAMDSKRKLFGFYL
ncbi:hypothetical protein J4H10_08685 [Vibrio alginolyticus]|uniref:glucosamine inositolphosphorylceramide transferase family protein n=1 Tax=Vibrio alginolyticus TaxID=663 RepID=UPI001BD39F90|nr:hypothetical protein [Vibrio alginolyticus]MBS9914479.1 hypothetical protein [Vibrio alginolyticus]